MKDLKVILLFATLFLLAFGCGNSEIPDDKYFSGKVIVKAEKNSPLGLIKLIHIYTKDSIIVRNDSKMDTLYNVEDQHMSEPSKAVLYEFVDNVPLDLGEQVWVKICEKGGIQIAKSYKKKFENKTKMPSPPSSELFNIQERHKYIARVHINLHNADKHREGPKHKKIHTGASIDLLDVPGFTHIKRIIVTDQEASQAAEVLVEESYYIKSGTAVEANTDYFTQFSYQLNDTIEVHTFDIEHIH